MTVTKYKTKYVAYYRVSTKDQEKNGHSLDAQKKVVADFIAYNKGELIDEYREAESGKSTRRPELKKALARAKTTGATLLVAKLDRLARNMAFTAMLMDSGVEFICCDNPHANRLTIHILAAVAEDEQRRISARTKEGLQAAKAKGVLLGSAQPGRWEGKEHLRGWKKAVVASAQLRKQATEDAYATIIPIIKEMQAHEQTLEEIVNALNKQGFRTQRGNVWTPGTLHRVIARAEGRTGKTMNKLSPEILERMHGKRAQGAELKDIAKWLNEQNILTPHGKKWDEFLVHRKLNPRRTKEKVTA